MAEVKCWCGDVLDVGSESRTVVAHCFKTNKSSDGCHWGSAATRFDYKGKYDEATTHVVQVDPAPAAEQKAKFSGGPISHPVGADVVDDVVPVAPAKLGGRTEFVR